jgi:hypothetical protein
VSHTAREWPQATTPSKHLIVGTGMGYYHMWDMIIKRNNIVTYGSIVGYLLKACDVVGTYHTWDMIITRIMIVTCDSIVVT